MNETVKTILERRSIRAFTKERISDEDLETIVECGRFAPNAWENESYLITVVRNEDIIKKLAEVTHKHLGGELSEHSFFGAGVIILVSDLRSSPSHLEDCAVVLENMFIAAKSLGIGSVWVHQLYSIHDIPDVYELLESLGVGRERWVCGIGAFGYPDEQPEAKPRKSRVDYFD